MLLSHSSKLMVVLLLASIFSPIAHAQITNVNDNTATPVHGVGHDYIGLLNETVNPATGSVSIRIRLPLPDEKRGPSLPFSIGYDSSGIAFPTAGSNPGYGAWGGPLSHWYSGGWSYVLPTLNYVLGKDYISVNPPVTYCSYFGDFVFSDPNGARIPLGLAVRSTSTYQYCSNVVYDVLTQTGEHYAAAIPSSYSFSAAAPPVAVTDADGTVYSFALNYGVLTGGGPPDFIEDRNGNKLVFNLSTSTPYPFNIQDAAGRTIISETGFGQTGNQITVSGFTEPFKITWQQLPTTTWSLAPQQISGGTSCPGGWPSWVGNLGKAVQTITLPNNGSFNFYYDSTYGLLQKVVYPSGGYVSYT